MARQYMGADGTWISEAGERQYMGAGGAWVNETQGEEEPPPEGAGSAARAGSGLSALGGGLTRAGLPSGLSSVG